MERVVTINLNGNPYQLEEPACDALRAYLDRAQAALASNPDKAEIVRDLEQAIADKCASYLSPHKSVVSVSEMTRVLEEMGPVDGEDPAQPRAEGAQAETPRKRLYRIKDRAVISGVCSGMGAYFDLDPNIVRLLFVLVTIITHGFALLIYVAMMFFVPSAHTSEEWAAAHGAPFNAQEVVDRAKREFDRFADQNGRSWRAQMRAQRRAWREQARAWRRGWDYPPTAPAAPAQPIGYATRVFAGLFAFVFSLVTAALLIAFLIALFSFINSGAILGWSPPADMPNWLVIVILAIAYAAISSPFSALRRSSYATLGGYRHYGAGADGLITLCLAALALWLAYLYWPAAHDMMDAVPDTFRSLGIYLD